ncbi:MAG TPA: undecaprenyl-diphosphate phosphatase, partial [Dehalococcoidia bacterium]
MSVLHAIILSLLQGAFELFPVSSLGHTVIVPDLLQWPEKRSNPSFLAFIVALHLGTATALLIFFWRDWLRIIAAMLASIQRRKLSDDPDEHLGWLIVAGSIPAGILGLLFKDALTDLFDKGWLAAMFLVLNGFVMLIGEALRRGMRRRIELPALSLNRGVGIGAAQALALLPGFSRSGTSMVGGLLAGLHHIDAARLSFMLATPLILAAGVLAIPDLFAPEANIGPGLAAMGYVISGVTAYLAV